jgi:Protein of unknown function (DUF5131)
MSLNSHIEWTDATWNPVRGCTKISPGCKHCYAETFAERFRGVDLVLLRTFAGEGAHATRANRRAPKRSSFALAARLKSCPSTNQKAEFAFAEFTVRLKARPFKTKSSYEFELPCRIQSAELPQR